ncbi:hypothetical protein CBR_g28479 [Chara braunii]|uniref:EF-hand domain-containing protein n=1 Tax=Chara braunii TaxID=69332 RepID=A0A388JWA4_CHABU|nr:hypothetical protein CBR_g28479 [Chara braunii]|eukprot:GBG62002.1 hypothetical protein CBR_g28479 [Chara braunii]
MASDAAEIGKKKLQNQLKELTEAFALFDTDRSGTITVEELGNLLQSLGQDLSEEELLDVVKEVDSNQTGSVEFREFVRVVEGGGKRGAALHKELADAFEVYDKSGDGHITHDELQEVLKKAGQNLSEKQVGAALKAADVDEDGKVSYKEFLKLLSVTNGQ